MKNKSKAGRPKTEPHVGIFWLLDGKPLIDSTPLSEAEPYGDHLTHPLGHDEVWEHYQQDGIVPADMEYHEAPRGRVMYNTRARRFTLLADKCILRDKDAVRRIMAEMNLPSKNMDKGTDGHYRCPACMRGNSSE